MTIANLTVQQFLEQNRITPETWKAADVRWEDLRSIGLAMESRRRSLTDTAAYLANTLQRCPEVHSVRWRVKDPEHFLEKVVRKRAEKKEKYLSIDADNYLRVVTDLIGLRALHLFKTDWRGVHEFIRETWVCKEDPVAYVRDGDSNDVRQAFVGAGCDVQEHPAGYRSVHYVVKTQPLKDEILAEVQVRTIFEEGWSEIDHRVRYPNFSNSDLLRGYLAVFNRFAGGADEMGLFVKSLASALRQHENELILSERRREEHLAKIESLVKALWQEQEKNERKEQQLKDLEVEVAALRHAQNIASGPAAVIAPGTLRLLGQHYFINTGGVVSSVAPIVCDECKRLSPMLGLLHCPKCSRHLCPTCFWGDSVTIDSDMSWCLACKQSV